MSKEITFALVGLLGTMIYGFVSLGSKLYDLKMEIRDLKETIKQRSDQNAR